MRSNKQIEAEVAALRAALLKPERWNDAAKNIIYQSIRVLERRLTAEEIENTYYIDEDDPDYRDGDNDLYNALMTVHGWMIGNRTCKPPTNDM